MAGVQLFQPNGAGILNEAGAQHPAPVTVEVDMVCQLSFVGGSTRRYRWVLTKPSGSHAVLSSTTSAGPSFLPDVNGGSYSISLFDIDETEYILDIVTPTDGVAGGGSGGSVATSVATYNDVRALSFAAGTPQAVTLIQCRATVDDGGGGEFAYDSSDTTTPDNDGTVLVDADGHRFKRIFSGAVDARWFGADGSDNVAGAVANTAAINAAIAAVPSGGALHFPAGTYAVTASPFPATCLVVENEGVRLFGDGDASVIHIVDDGAGDPAVSTFDAITITAENWRIEKLKFVGDLDAWDTIVNSQIDQRTAILAEAGISSHGVVDRCTFYRCLGHVVQEHGLSEDIDVTNCRIIECLNGINVSANGSKQTGNYLYRTNGIETAGDRTTIANNTFIESAGISCGGRNSGSDPTIDCIIANNIIRDIGANEGDNTGPGISLASASHIVVTGNDIRGAGSHGITAARVGGGPACGPFVIANNKIYTGSGIGHGIWLPTGNGTSITGNQVESTGNFGLLLEADDCLVENNILDGATNDLGVQFGLNNRIGSNNQYLNDTYYVEIGFGSSPTFSQPGKTQTVNSTGTTAVLRNATAVQVTANGSVTVTLPDPSKVGARWRVTVINSTAQTGTTTLATDAGSIIGVSAIAGAGKSATVESDGTNWYAVGSELGDKSGTLTPEGSVTGSVGDTFRRKDGGSSATLYAKVSGTATTSGWENIYTSVDELQVTRVVRNPPLFADPTLWSVDEKGRITCNTTAGDAVFFYLDMHNGATIDTITATVIGGGNASLPAVMPRFRLRRHFIANDTDDATSAAVDASADASAYNAIHTITLSGIALTVSNNARYMVEFVSESGANAVTGFTILGVEVTMTSLLASLDRGSA